MFAVCFLHQTQPVKLRGALTGVCLGAKNEEEMNYMAPSHSPADSISAESQPHGRVCERSAHKYHPTPHATPKGPLWWWCRKDVAVCVIECCWSWPWAHPCALSPSGRPTAEPFGLKGLAWRRAAAQQQDAPRLLSFWHENTDLVQRLQRPWTE